MKYQALLMKDNGNTSVVAYRNTIERSRMLASNDTPYELAYHYLREINGAAAEVKNLARSHPNNPDRWYTLRFIPQTPIIDPQTGQAKDLRMGAQELLNLSQEFERENDQQLMRNFYSRR